MKRTGLFFAALFLIVLAARLCHSGILWAEEGLPLAAAAEMLRGKVLYRDIWFDKPPFLAYVYLLWGSHIGWILRLAGAVYVLASAAMVWRFARDLWGRREAFWAAGLLAFFLTFEIPSAALPLAADLLMVLPHVAAVYFASQGRGFWSGVCAGVAFLFNAKGVFVAATCAVWLFPGVLFFGLGFLLPNLAALGWLWAHGALVPYYEQVWVAGRLYAGGTFLADPVREGILRTINWCGFHVAAVAAACWYWWKKAGTDRWRWAVWAALSLAAVVMGWRFFPRYYFQLLPIVVLAGARGLALLPRRYVLVLTTFLLIPFFRFGPRYVLLAAHQLRGGPIAWADVAMDQDSRQAAAIARAWSRPGDTLFVWGFRPELYSYTRLPAANRFLDSQPLTGIPADRHLTWSQVPDPERTRSNREELIRSSPTLILDGLGLYNPRLALTAFPDLQPWLGPYREVARSQHTIVYRRF